MVVLDQFYQIIEKKSDDVSPLWKLLHTSTCFFSAGCAFLTSFCFGRILGDFNYNCILFADLVFDNNTYLNLSKFHGPNDSQVHAIELSETLWGATSTCSFAQFTPLVMMISAIVWGVYFGIMSRGGAGHPTDLLTRPWSILYTCIFFTIVFFITYVASTEKLKNGLAAFCDGFRPQLNNTGCTQEIDIYTAQFVDVRRVFFYDFYPNVQVAVISATVGIWSWVFHLAVCVVRICVVADFDLQLVTIVSKGEEVLENVVELADHEEESL